MNFVYPQFLFALLALGIPVIVHLFNFRKFKKVFFTNVRFLQEIKKDTRHRSRLKHLLVLTSRLLAILFLVFAFAQPYLPAKKGVSRAAKNLVSIWIDNSFSMNAAGKYGPLLETAKERAREIASSYSPSDRFQLITNDFEAKHQRIITKEELLQWIDEIKPSSSVRSLEEIIRRQDDAFNANTKTSGESYNAFLLSDFQTGLFSNEALPLDSSVHYFALPFEANATGNLYIDTCYLNTPFIQPGSSQDLIVRVKNSGDEIATNIPVKLTINAGLRAVSSVSVEPGSFSDIKLPFTIPAAGFQQAAVSITDYPVTFDDTFYLTFNVRPNVHVTSINGNDVQRNFLDALYANDSYFSYRSLDEGKVDYNAFSAQQLIILNGVKDYSSGLQLELKNYMDKGGKVMIIPSTSSSTSNYTAFSTALNLPSLTGPLKTTDRIKKLDSGHPLLSGIFEQNKNQPENIDLPTVQQTFLQNITPGSKCQSVIEYDSKTPFLSYTPIGTGGCYVLSVPLNTDFSNFQQHALFVPVFLRAVLMGSSEINSGNYTGTYSTFSAGDTTLSGDQVFHVINKTIGFDAIPNVKRTPAGTELSLDDQVKIAGNYEILAGGTMVNAISFNYNRRESNLIAKKLNEISEAIGSTSSGEILDADNTSVGHTLAGMRDGISLWKYCILLTLLFLAIEILLIRYLK